MLMRFDLSEDNKGPQATAPVEGFQIHGLVHREVDFLVIHPNSKVLKFKTMPAINNGDAMVMYNRYVYSTGSSMSRTP